MFLIGLQIEHTQGRLRQKKESKIKEKGQNKSVLCEVEADRISTDSGGGAPE